MELIKDYQVGERKDSRLHESDYLLVSQRSGKMTGMRLGIG